MLLAKRKDRNFEVFGADKHKYVLHNPATENEVLAFEKQFDITLPECYKSFLLFIGNGGISYLKSGAGPFLGIYPLGFGMDDLCWESTSECLKSDCILYPGMSDEFWQGLINRIEIDDEISDVDYNEEMGKIFSGIMPIGSQGCTYVHGIVLNGEHKGRVMNLDIDRQKPKFAYEPNFLDWYERWLNEVISGELTKTKPSWFGYSPSKSPIDVEVSVNRKWYQF